MHRLPADESSSYETTKAVELILWVQLWSQHQQEAINKQKKKKVLGQNPRVKLLFTVIVAVCNHATYFMWQIKQSVINTVELHVNIMESEGCYRYHNNLFIKTTCLLLVLNDGILIKPLEHAVSAKHNACTYKNTFYPGLSECCQRYQNIFQCVNVRVNE